MSFRAVTLAALVLPGLAHATTTAADTFGYAMTDEGTFAWEDLTTTGTVVLNFGDDNEVEVALPFTFPWYGGTYDFVTIGGNGGLAFTQGTGTVQVGYRSDRFPNLETGNIYIAPDIAMFWQDLDLGRGGDVYAATLANGCFAIAFVDAMAHAASVNGTSTFEAILCDDGSVTLQYLGNTLDNGNEDGAEATAGIEDRAGGTALDGNAVVWSIHEAVLTAGVRLDVIPSPCLADVTDTDGDGACDLIDACVGDDATGDTDADGTCDDLDVCLGTDATGDSDGDGTCDDFDVCAGDDATGDSDGDGVCDDSDVCVGDDATGDGDGDGVCDDGDVCAGDDATGDTDSDGTCDDSDVVAFTDDPVPGQAWTLSAQVPTSGTRVYFFVSRTGAGTGPCMGSVCIGLDTPFYVGAAVSDATGLATRTATVPRGVPSGTVLSMQAAAVLQGSPQTSNVATASTP